MLQLGQIKQAPTTLKKRGVLHLHTIGPLSMSGLSRLSSFAACLGAFESQIAACSLRLSLGAKPLSMERRVLIRSPTGQDALLAVQVFELSGITSAVSLHAEALVQHLRHGASCVLPVEEALTGAALKIVVDHIAAQPTWSDIPVLLMTHSGADSEVMQRVVAELGNVTLMECPLRARQRQ